MGEKRRYTEGLFSAEKVLEGIDVREGMTVIDMGFGNGYMSLNFSERVGGSGSVIAVDVNSEQVEDFKRSGLPENIEVICADATVGTGLDDSIADVIYISTVFHIFSGDKLKSFIKEIKRLLKSDGVIVIVEIIKAETGFGPPMDKRYSEEEVVALTGMTEVGRTMVSDAFYMLTLK